MVAPRWSMMIQALNRKTRKARSAAKFPARIVTGNSRSWCETNWPPYLSARRSDHRNTQSFPSRLNDLSRKLLYWWGRHVFVFPPVTRSSTHLAPFAALMCCQISLVTGDNLAQMTTSRVRWNHQIYTDWINSVYLNDTEKFPARFLSDRRPRVHPEKRHSH